MVGVSLVTALILELKRGSHADEADKLQTAVGENGCGAGTPNTSECASLHDENVSRNRAKDYRNVALITAGVGAAAFVGYVVLVASSGGNKAPQPHGHTWTVTPVVDGTSAGAVTLTGSVLNQFLRGSSQWSRCCSDSDWQRSPRAAVTHQDIAFVSFPTQAVRPAKPRGDSPIRAPGDATYGRGP